MDCILGYHLNPLTCGVAKHNLILADRFKVPVLGVFDPAALSYQRPLLSFKTSEFSEGDIAALDPLLNLMEKRQSLQLFLHDFSGTDIELRMVRRAKIVYCGNAELVAQLRDIRPDVVEVWCPGSILETQRFNRVELSVFSFGMAHKVRADHYGKLRTLLEQTGKPYCIYLSTALHDGTSFDGSFTAALEELREVFGDNIYFMGYLSDMAVFNYLAEATFFAAFFDKGVRANNTSVNAAMRCGSVVITNLDQHSPKPFAHMDTLLDIQQCDALPAQPEILARIGARAQEAAQTLGWDALMAKMMRHEAEVA